MTDNAKSSNPFEGAEIFSGGDVAPTANEGPAPVSPLPGGVPPSDGSSLPVDPPVVPPGSAGPEDLAVIIPKKIPCAFTDPVTGSIISVDGKDRTFIRHLFEMGAKGAEKNAHISHTRAEHLLNLPAIQNYLRKVLWEAGVDDRKIAERIAEGLDATVTKEYCLKDGTLVQGEERTDFEQRGKYIDRAVALQGLQKPDPVAAAAAAGVPIGGSPVLAGLTPDQLVAVAKALQEVEARKTAPEAEVVPPSPAPAVQAPPPPPDEPQAAGKK